MNNRLQYKIYRRRRHSLRRGIAPLELALALPILMVMMSIIFGVCSVTETRMMTTTAARNNAFEKRHKPWEHDAQTLELSEVQKVEKILGPSPVMPAKGGLVSGIAASAPTGMFGPLSKLTLATQSERFVLGGGWDYQEIEFKKHSPLILTDKAKYFGMKASEINAFKGLGSFGAGFGGSGSIGQMQGQVQQSLQDARREVTARLAEIQRQMKQLSSQLSLEKHQQANLRKNPNADPNSIQKADKQVKKTQAKIDELKSEQSKQQQASGSMGVDSKLPAAGHVSASEELGN
ncbi:MAG: TadE family protein [Pirellulaceae bacterium]|nr:TadE family protein [Pirellulaceae bacterium]